MLTAGSEGSDPTAAMDGEDESPKGNPLPRTTTANMALPAAVVGIVVMMVIPLPTTLLDLLLSLNIAAAVLILLASMNVSRALDLASFPSLLLVATLFRLGLNVSTTRLILGEGEAGGVITAFGSFVMGGSVVVGLVVFLILVVIQFVVITNGATRVAEVGARFTLDAMPGKQMAIDADLNAGIISDAEATRRRTEISSEADFYGAMDGASKFVKGDAIAGIVITLINLIGGLIIGVLQQGMTIGDAGSTYSLLTVGDGLVSQIPALLILDLVDHGRRRTPPGPVSRRQPGSGVRAHPARFCPCRRVLPPSQKYSTLLSSIILNKAEFASRARDVRWQPGWRPPAHGQAVSYAPEPSPAQGQAVSKLPEPSPYTRSP